jgi:ADP-ribose pyrophosphatase YjhB (NUDIX family)
MDKPIKHAISVVIKNERGETLFARRSAHKKEFPLVWSLPSHFVVDGETPEQTIRRIGHDKLGVDLQMEQLLNEGYGERSDFRLFMHDYAATVLSGKPHIASGDFVELQWATAENFLPTIKTKGDCTRLYGEFLQRSTLAKSS